MKHAFIFPGQGSQHVGMLADLAELYPVVKDTFTEASDILGYDVWALSQSGPKETLDETDKTQPALLAASISIWRIWQQQCGILPSVMAGHSFGEYSALVCAGALEYKEAVSLAQDRGLFMQSAVPAGQGAMAAILGLEDATVITLCQQAKQGEVLSAVNFNAPAQVVIAGHTTAVERAIALAKEQGAKHAVMLHVSVPAHCELMKPAAERMAERLASVTISPPKIPVIHNVDLTTKSDPEAIRAALVAQLYSPVNWVETIKKIDAQGITTLFKAGPGRVLLGLNKRISKQINTLAMGDKENLEKAFQIVAETSA